MRAKSLALLRAIAAKKAGTKAKAPLHLDRDAGKAMLEKARKKAMKPKFLRRTQSG